MPKLFEWHGYFRSGFGVNAKGGDQDAFQAPGAYSKYRLGNETETYGELRVRRANWVNPDHNDTWFKTNVKLASSRRATSTFDRSQRRHHGGPREPTPRPATCSSRTRR